MHAQISSTELSDDGSHNSRNSEIQFQKCFWRLLLAQNGGKLPYLATAHNMPGRQRWLVTGAACTGGRGLGNDRAGKVKVLLGAEDVDVGGARRMRTGTKLGSWFKNFTSSLCLRAASFTAAATVGVHRRDGDTPPNVHTGILGYVEPIFCMNAAASTAVPPLIV